MIQYKQQFYKELGTNIKRRREALKKTQDVLANETGTNRTTVINIERGQQQLPVHLLVAFATALEEEPFNLVPKMLNLEDRPAEQRNWIEAGLRTAGVQG